MKAERPNAKGAGKRSVILWIAIVITGLVIWGVVANSPRQGQRTQTKSAVDTAKDTPLNTALELIKAKRYAETESFFNEIDNELLGANPEERKRRIEDFNSGLEEPPTDSKDENGEVVRTAEEKMVLRKQVAESIRFYSGLCKDPDALFPAARHLIGFDDKFIDAVGDFERFGLRNVIVKALESPTDRQYEQLAEPFLREGIVQWFKLPQSIGSRWSQVGKDTRGAGQLVGRLRLAEAVFRHPEPPPMFGSGLPQTTAEIIRQHGIVVASRFVAGIMDVDPALPDRGDLNSKLAAAFEKGWNSRWEERFMPSIGLYDEADWGNILTGFIAEVAQAQKADEQTIARLGLVKSLDAIRTQLMRAGFDPYDHKPFTDSLRHIAGDFPGYGLSVNHALIAAGGVPVSVGDIVRVAEDLARNHMACELMSFYQQVDARLLGPDPAVRRESGRPSSGNGEGVAQAFDFYTKLLLTPEAIIPTASHLAGARKRLVAANLKIDFEAIGKKQREVLAAPTEFQYVQFREFPLRYNLSEWEPLMASYTGSQWKLLETSPREVGATLARMRKQRDRNRAGEQRVILGSPNELCSAVIVSHGLVTAAKVLAGFCDVEPSLVARIGLGDGLHHVFVVAWTQRWKQMVTARGGIPANIDWKDLYSDYLSGVADQLSPDEQWFAACGLKYALSGQREPIFRHKRGEEDDGGYLAALRDITKGTPAFRFVVEDLGAIGIGWHKPRPNADLGPFALSATLREFITSDTTPLFARLHFCANLSDVMRFAETEYSPETVAAINHCYARTLLKCLEETGSTLTAFPSGDEWNPTRAMVGRALLRRAGEISDKTTKRHKILDSISLLLRAGEIQQASDGALRHRELLSDSTVMFSKLLEVGAIDAALEFAPTATNATPSTLSGYYTEAVDQFLPVLLQKIEDPTLRYIVAVTVNSSLTKPPGKLPSRLQRLLPLAEKFDEIAFPDEASKLRCLTLLCKEPLAAASGGAARELHKWGAGACMNGAGVVKYDHNATGYLEPAFLGLLLRESRIKELEQWFEAMGDAISTPQIDDLVPVFYEHTLHLAADRDFAAIAACIPISRRLYQLRADRSSTSGGNARPVKVWLDLCHAAGDRIKTIRPWIEGVGGHVAEIYRDQEKFNVRGRPDTSIGGLLYPASSGLSWRWGEPENAAVRQGVIMAFLNDSSFREAYAGPPAHPLVAALVNDVHVPRIEDSLVAIREWQRLNPEKAKDLAGVLKVSEKLATK